MNFEQSLAVVMRDLARTLDNVQMAGLQLRGTVEGEREFLTTTEVAARQHVRHDSP